ncbi:MAG: TetR/AcrR family transcriptional regulator [Streptosporangiaceae bacterium]|nr:TetR/AcrR family transcriptional regulator [Streptosporangiaceae bacterium]
MDAGVPSEIVAAAVAAASERGQDVADVSLTVIATAAGISRSTLLRRIGNSRTALDDAVRATGVDPGGRPPVRERAIEATARLIAESGLASLTLDAVADAAQCSLPSLHLTFGGRDGLLTAVFERYSPLHDFQQLMAARSGEFVETVQGVHRALLTAFTREPRVLPALAADLFSRPDGPAGRMLRQNSPRLLASLSGWLTAAMDSGQIRRMPLPLLAQLLVAPVAFHALSRPVLAPVFGASFPSVDQACEIFADAFLRAVARDRPPEPKENDRGNP